MTDEEMDRRLAERHHHDELGQCQGFDYEAVDQAGPTELLADEINDRFGGRKIEPGLALELALFCGGRNSPSVNAEVDHALVLETLRSMLERIVSAPKPWLEASCLLMAIGVRESNKDSMRHLATQRGVTVAAVSKRVKEIREVYELPISTFNKSALAVESYKLTNGKRSRP